MKRRRVKKEAREPPEQTEWHDLVRLNAVQDFATDTPVEGELLRAHRYGRRIVVAWDKRRGATVCPRAVMALWYAFVFDTLD